MKMKFLRVLSLIVLCSMLAGIILTGCGKTEETSASTSGSSAQTSTAASEASTAAVSSADSGPNEWKSDTSPFTFRQYFYGTWATNYIWKDQYAMKLATEKTGVTIDRFLATGNDDDYLNTLIAADDLPDSLMLDWNKPVVKKLISNEMLYSLTDLIKQYCPNFNNILNQEMVTYHSVDGNLYYLPNFYTTLESVKNGRPGIPIRPWYVRKDIYEAIGSPKMETPEDLLAALKLAKQKFPEVYPVGLEKFDVNSELFKGSRSMDYLIYAFSPELEHNRIKDDTKTMEYPMRDNGFREAFRFLNKLNSEGLFDPQLLIYKQEQFEEKLFGAKYFTTSMYASDISLKFNPKIESTLGKDKIYQSLDVMKVDGKDPKYPNTRMMGWQGFFITKKAKNPERIIKFLEYGWSDEGQMDFRYGKEGETYEMKDGYPFLKKDIEDLRNKDKATFDAKYGFDCSTLLWRGGELWDKADQINFKVQQPEQFATLTKYAKYNEDVFPLGIENVEPDGASPEGVIHAKIKDLWNKTIPKIVLAKSNEEFDTIYNSFLAQMDKVGAQKVEKVMYQKHIEEVQKKTKVN